MAGDSLQDERWLHRFNNLYIAAILVAAVATVFIYVLATRVTKAKDSELAQFRKESDVKIAQADKDAAEAKLRAESAIAEQEKLRQQNLGLSLKLEQERAARLVIEEKIAPRRLTVEQKANMVRVLSAYRGQKYTIDCARGNSEATNLAWDFKEVFEKAGWQMIMSIRNEMVGFSNVMDLPFLGVQYVVNVRTTSHPAAKALRDLLQEYGFKTQGVALEGRHYELDTIYFWVGAKPLN